MTTETIKQEITELIFKLFKDRGLDINVTEHADLLDQLEMDSITFISIVVEIESYFNIEIPDDMLLPESFNSVDNIVSLIENELKIKTEKQ